MDVDFIGASDVESQTYPSAPNIVIGTMTYWPPNFQYSAVPPGEEPPRNVCTWCDSLQAEELNAPPEIGASDAQVHPFLASAMMERSLFQHNMEALKLLMVDPLKNSTGGEEGSIYLPDYGFECVSPLTGTVSRPGYTARGFTTFTGAGFGRKYFCALGHSYSLLSIYEGLATVRRRSQLITTEGLTVNGNYEPGSQYVALSDILDNVEGYRAKINNTLHIAETTRGAQVCEPPTYGKWDDPDWAPKDSRWAGVEGDTGALAKGLKSSPSWASLR